LKRLGRPRIESDELYEIDSRSIKVATVGRLLRAFIELLGFKRFFRPRSANFVAPQSKHTASGLGSDQDEYPDPPNRDWQSPHAEQSLPWDARTKQPENPSQLTAHLPCGQCRLERTLIAPISA
jgi:hypothetical protein